MDVIFQFVQQTNLQKLIMAIFANLDKCKNQIQDTSSSSKSSQLKGNDRLFDFNLNPLFYFSFSSPKTPSQIFLLFKSSYFSNHTLPQSSYSPDPHLQLTQISRNHKVQEEKRIQKQFISQPFARDAARQWKGNGNITQASKR